MEIRVVDNEKSRKVVSFLQLANDYTPQVGREINYQGKRYKVIDNNTGPLMPENEKWIMVVEIN
ncbi:hypothetical protein [Facklamia sp. P12934]|uniref:hypothetical protein n=1 Tax=unclassified Facklamia TaxID=2622293 RepID=UPI003D169EC3